MDVLTCKMYKQFDIEKGLISNVPFLFMLNIPKVLLYAVTV